jgi:branched-chain amino acid transport system permease protein
LTGWAELIEPVALGAWTELIASGGGIYALVAIGLNLQYGLMRIMNIAHGEFLMLGAYLTWMMRTAPGRLAAADDARSPSSLLMALGMAIHWLCFSQVAARAPNVDVFEARSLMVGFGLMFLVQNLVLGWGGDLRGYDYLADPVQLAEMRFAATSCWCSAWRWRSASR